MKFEGGCWFETAVGQIDIYVVAYRRENSSSFSKLSVLVFSLGFLLIQVTTEDA